MAGFGGSVKLTGESDYRKALQQITSDLKTMSSALKSQTEDFNSNDRSIKNSANAQKQLNDTIKQQQQSINTAKSSLSGYTVEMQRQTTIHNQLNKEYKNAVLELERIKKTSGETSDEYKKQAQVVDQLEKELIDSQTKLDENKEAMSSLKKEINASQKVIDEAQKSLNDMGEELDDTEKSTKKAGDGFTVFKGILANLGTQAINGVINGLKKLGSAMINVGKQAISSYAEFEQLKGGVESMFGGTEKGAEQINKVLGLSEKAWQDLTMSQNDYITAFNSTYPLMKNDIQDQNEAIDKTNRIMRLNSDLANTFGYSMDQAATAVNWALKGTYSYLDNLNIGIKGTKEGFLEAAKSVGYTVKSVDELSSSDILDILEKCADRYGVLGKTADEANQTIQGSTKMVKSAWENLLTGIADGNQEIGPLIQNFVDSVAIAWENLKPRIKEAVKGIKKAISELWENRGQIKEDFPELAPIINAFEWIIDNKELVVGSITAILGAFAIGKVASFVNTMVTLGTTLAGIPAVAGMASTAMTALGTAFTFMTGPIGIAIAAIGAVVGAIVLLWNKSETFRNFWKDVWEGIKTTVSNAVESVVTFFKKIPENINKLVQDTIKFFSELPNKIAYLIGLVLGHILKFGVDTYNWVTTEVPKIIEGIIKFFSELPGKIWNFLVNTYEKVSTWGINMTNKAIETGKNFVDKAINFIKELPSKVWNFLTNTISKVIQWGSDLAAKGKEAASNLVTSITNKVKELPEKMADIGKNLVKGIWNGISNMTDWILDKIKGFGKSVLKGIKKVFGIESPSKLMRDQVGKFLAEGIGVGFEDEMKNVTQEMQNAIPTSFDTSINSNTSSDGSSIFSYDTMLNAFKEALSDMKIELDDEVAGKFVERTVARAIYN